MIKRELSIFLIVGLLTVLIDFLTYRSLIWLDFSIACAKGSGFITGTIFAYFANRIWTFGHTHSAPGSLWRFILLYTITLGANILVNTIALKSFDQAALALQLAFLLATGVSATLNFWGMKWFVFRTPSESEFV